MSNLTSIELTLNNVLNVTFTKDFDQVVYENGVLFLDHEKNEIRVSYEISDHQFYTEIYQTRNTKSVINQAFMAAILTDYLKNR